MLKYRTCGPAAAMFAASLMAAAFAGCEDSARTPTAMPGNPRVRSLLQQLQFLDRQLAFEASNIRNADASYADLKRREHLQDLSDASGGSYYGGPSGIMGLSEQIQKNNARYHTRQAYERTAARRMAVVQELQRLGVRF